jgi:hypothetical protein
VRTDVVIAACWMLFLSGCAVSPPRVECEPAEKRLPDRERLLFSSYMMCYPIGRPYVGHSYDRPLDRPEAGRHNRLIDLQHAVGAGIDALIPCLFMQSDADFRAFDVMADLIEQHNLPIRLAPMFDGFHFPGITEDKIFSRISGWFERHAARPCIVKRNGKPVLFTFEAGRRSPEEWRNIFDRLDAAGCDGFWICEGGGAISQQIPPRFDLRAPWFRLFDAGFTFFTNPKVPEPAIRNSRLYEERYGDEGKFWVGTALWGYWRPEIAAYTSPRGTAQYRDTWAAARAAGNRWIQQATWNDFSENHHIMPSAMKGTTFTELTRFLARDWKGLPNDLAEPRLFLSRMHEVQVGERLLFETLGLFPDGVERATFELALRDAEGELVHAFEPRVHDVAGLAAPLFRYALTNMPPGRMLVPTATLTAEGFEPVEVTGEPTVVSPNRFHPERSRAWIYTPAHRTLADAACEFFIDGVPPGGTVADGETPGTASFRVASPVPLIDVEVLRDGMPVVAMRRAEDGAFPAADIARSADLPRDRNDRLARGFYQLRATAQGHRTIWSDPVFVEGGGETGGPVAFWDFEDAEDHWIRDASGWDRDAMLGGRTRYPEQRPALEQSADGGTFAFFDGTNDWILMKGPVLPQASFTVECSIRPAVLGALDSEGGGEAVILSSENGTIQLELEPDGTLRLGRKSRGDWAWATGDRAVVPDEWTHLAAVFDGRTLTLYIDGEPAGETSAPGAGPLDRFGVGYRYNDERKREAFYRGGIDDLRIHERVLSPEEFLR